MSNACAPPAVFRARPRQRGAALLVFALILVVGTSWMLVSSLNKASADRNTSVRTQSGDVLKQSKDALIGYVITQAATTLTSDLSYKHPGQFPCPEDLSYKGTANEGIAAGSCTLPAIGRLPWRTLGLTKPLDGSGEPLWYVLSTGWTGPSTPVDAFKINSDTPGNLTVDGTANSAIALLIAPGPPLTLSPNSNQIAAGCVARTQNRSGSLDHRDYLECENATSPANATFVTSVIDNATNEVFNDHVAAVRVNDLMPALDGVIAKRIAEDISPALAGVYSSVDWGATATKRWFPFAAALGDTSASGVAANRRGIMPAVYTKLAGSSTIDCVVSASDPRCNPTFVAWKTGGILSFTASLPIPNNPRYSVYSTIPTISVPSSSPYISVTEVANSDTTRGTLSKVDCSATISTQLSCAVTYGRACPSYPSACGARTVQPRIRITARALNVAKAFKAFETNTLSLLASTFQSRATATSYGASPLGTLRSDGDADITTEWLLPSKSCTISQCFTYTVTIPIALLVDHSIVNGADTTRGWFVANDWHRVTYYGIGSGYAPGGTGSCSGATCVTITGGATSPAYKGAILIFAGRDLLSPAPLPARRPSSTLAQYLEGVNAVADDSYESKSASTTFNDRLVTVYP